MIWQRDKYTEMRKLRQRALLFKARSPSVLSNGAGGGGGNQGFPNRYPALNSRLLPRKGLEPVKGRKTTEQRLQWSVTKLSTLKKILKIIKTQTDYVKQ